MGGLDIFEVYDGALDGLQWNVDVFALDIESAGGNEIIDGISVVSNQWYRH